MLVRVLLRERPPVEAPESAAVPHHPRLVPAAAQAARQQPRGRARLDARAGRAPGSARRHRPAPPRRDADARRVRAPGARRGRTRSERGGLSAASRARHSVSVRPHPDAHGARGIHRQAHAVTGLDVGAHRRPQRPRRRSARAARSRPRRARARSRDALAGGEVAHARSSPAPPTMRSSVSRAPAVVRSPRARTCGAQPVAANKQRTPRARAPTGPSACVPGAAGVAHGSTNL